MEARKSRGLFKHASWYINLNSRPAVKQSLTIAVTTGPKNDRIQVVSVTVKLVELLARVKNQENGTDGKIFILCFIVK
jgi:hypothetical protein